MTKAEARLVRELYERNHRLCAVYIFIRNLVKWPLEVLVVFPFVVVFATVFYSAQCVWNILKDIREVIVEKCYEFVRDWGSVYRAWVEAPKTESEV